MILIINNEYKFNVIETDIQHNFIRCQALDTDSKDWAKRIYLCQMSRGYEVALNLKPIKDEDFSEFDDATKYHGRIGIKAKAATLIDFNNDGLKHDLHGLWVTGNSFSSNPCEDDEDETYMMFDFMV